MGSACRNLLRKLFLDWRRRFGDRRNRRGWIRRRRRRFVCRNLTGEWQWPGGSRSHSLGAKRNGPEPQDEKSGQYQDTGNRPFPELLQQLLRCPVPREQSVRAWLLFSGNRLARASARGQTWQFCLGLAQRLSSFPQFLNVLHDLHAALITLGGIFRHRSCNDVIEPRRQLGIENGRRYRFVVDYLERDRKGAFALKRPVTCQDRV